MWPWKTTAHQLLPGRCSICRRCVVVLSILLPQKYSSFCIEYKLLRPQPGWVTLYPWNAEKRWAPRVIYTSASHAGLALVLTSQTQAARHKMPAFEHCPRIMRRPVQELCLGLSRNHAHVIYMWVRVWFVRVSAFASCILFCYSCWSWSWHQTRAARHKVPALEPMFWGTFKHQLLPDKTINPLGDSIYMPVLWIVFREASLLWVLMIQ